MNTGRTHFTPETARIAGAKGGVLSGISKSEAEKKRLQSMQEAITSITYVDHRVTRTRKQIALIEDRILQCSQNGDSKKAKEWGDTLARLNEIERQLAGRPMPGSLKPQQPRRNSASSEPIPEPIQAAPMPVAPVAPAPAKTPQARLNCGVAPTMYSVQLFSDDPQKPQSSEVA